MTRFKYDSDLIKLMMLFESMSGAKVKDCISNDKVLFIVGENDMGRAIGKNGANIKKFENKLKKKVKLAEFSSDVAQFVRNLAYPAEISDVKNEGGIITIHGRDSNSRAMLIGRERQNLNHLTEIVKRYFDVKEIKVI
ncbi:NusA-like transcription termination signal-binding factor [Candidatus Woesearchaeota archaeon]|nr:NusA-like transcription termination signal-binding factor [Candidatus Woesearchaeota archaeon]